MKKISCLLFAFGCFCFAFLSPIKLKGFALSAEPYKAMATMEVSSSRLLFAHNEKERLPMASTTKILTAIYVIQHTPNLDAVVEIPKEAQGVEGSSIYLRAGEHLTIKELLFGLMLQSGNDAAVALALTTENSVENFCEKVNKFVADIGATDTHIVTPNGLHHKDHYTTAQDLALITCYAMKNPVFREIVQTQKTEISNEFKTEPRYIKNKNKLLKNMQGATGVKTGYTSQAGRCLVASCERDGMEVVSVVLNCRPMFEECEKLLNKALQTYKIYEILPEYNHIGSCTIQTSNGSKNVNIISKNGFKYPLTEAEHSSMRVIINLPKTLSAPIEKGQEMGEIEIYLSKQLIFSTKIYSIESVKEINFKDILNKVIKKML